MCVGGRAKQTILEISETILPYYIRHTRVLQSYLLQFFAALPLHG